MPPLQLRQEFPTLKAFKEALHAWAIEAHFEPRILKSDTGRVRIGCKRDPNCPFVIRCNWERKNNREPLARVTVLKDKHTCLNGVEWLQAATGGMPMGNHDMNGHSQMAHGQMMEMGNIAGVGIRQDDDGNIVGGARVLGNIERPGREVSTSHGIVPVLPKVQRNSASRLPFLLDILPRIMNITKETTPVEIKDCLMREYGAEVHLQQCRRAKTEILKKAENATEENQSQNHQNGQSSQNNQNGSLSLPRTQEMRTQEMRPQDIRPEMRTQEMRPPELRSQDLRGQELRSQNDIGIGSGPSGDGQQQQQQPQPQQQIMLGMNSNSPSPLPYVMHPAADVGPSPGMPDRSSAAMRTVGEAPVRCPYCINHRWMKSIQDAVEHMSMHVVV